MNLNNNNNNNNNNKGKKYILKFKFINQYKVSSISFPVKRDIRQRNVDEILINISRKRNNNHLSSM